MISGNYVGPTIHERRRIRQRHFGYELHVVADLALRGIDGTRRNHEFRTRHLNVSIAGGRDSNAIVTVISLPCRAGHRLHFTFHSHAVKLLTRLARQARVTQVVRSRWANAASTNHQVVRGAHGSCWRSERRRRGRHRRRIAGSRNTRWTLLIVDQALPRFKRHAAAAVLVRNHQKRKQKKQTKRSNSTSCENFCR